MLEDALERGDWSIGYELANYFWDEMKRMGDALYLWLEDIVAAVTRVGEHEPDSARAASLLKGLAEFDVASGDRERALRACDAHDAATAVQSVELMRLRWASIHDALVAWIQQLIGDMADARGEEAVFAMIEQTYERLWRNRYAVWYEMTPVERLALSVEGMRGHLSGSGRRGDVGIIEQADCYVMVLDPCGSCGILRRGDPESGRGPANPSGNRAPHAWTWNRTGVGWYALHSPIVMEFLPTQTTGRPLRPLRNCDRDEPCLWYIFKDPQDSHVMEPSATPGRQST